MVSELTPDVLNKLEHQIVIWIASVRPDDRPHLAPVWFVWHQGKLYISTDPKSVKANNLRQNPRISLALEDGTHPVICEGTAQPVPVPWSVDLLAAFVQKYEWDITKEQRYNDLWEITPHKWLSW